MRTFYLSYQVLQKLIDSSYIRRKEKRKNSIIETKTRRITCEAYTLKYVLLAAMLDHSVVTGSTAEGLMDYLVITDVRSE